MTWPRAMAVAIAASGLLTLVLMLIPHWLLTALPFGTRGVRVALATGWIALSTVAVLILGRRWLPPRGG
jgi:hypothetical protein